MNIPYKYKKLISSMLNIETTSDVYIQTMIAFGEKIAAKILACKKNNTIEKYYIVTDIKDADYLTNSVINGLISLGVKDIDINMACFATETIPVFFQDNVPSLAYISDSYFESCVPSESVIIIVSTSLLDVYVRAFISKIYNYYKADIPNKKFLKIICATPVIENDAAQDLKVTLNLFTDHSEIQYLYMSKESSAINFIKDEDLYTDEMSISQSKLLTKRMKLIF
jgi:hypothetical protein